MAKAKQKRPSPNGKKPAKIAANTNGNSSERNEKKTKKSLKTKKGSLLSLPVCVVVATMSFLVGICTPPLLTISDHRSPPILQSMKSFISAITKSSIPSLPIKPFASNKSKGEDTSSFTIYKANARVECTPENLANFLHDYPERGLHIACIKPSREDKSSLSVSIYNGAVSDRMDMHSVEKNWDSLKSLLVRRLGLSRSNNKPQRWGIFTSHGEKIANADANPKRKSSYLRRVVESELIVIIAGGTWIWPGVRVGFERTVSLNSFMPSVDFVKKDSHKTALAANDTIVLETLSLVPLLLSVKNFLSTDECDHIQTTSEPKMKYSGVSLKDGDKGKAASEWRTSQTAFLYSKGDPILEHLDERVARLARIPVQHQEQVQVLRYGHLEKYDSHHDYFDPRHYKNSPDIQKMTDYGEKNRQVTVFWYLSDVEEGGETIFPRSGGAAPPRSNKDCSKGVKVKPEKGKVIIFYSLHFDGEPDEYSLHGACPVKDGIKWAANKWIWSAPMGFVS
mmetsp:Transcript_46834/g.69286  ORF Transcript_46834/g.69286 Transcript_46834/m.69286 type:complete len:508 (+) Transcript_46834:49-1572(+)